jgi:hypothetical protein
MPRLRYQGGATYRGYDPGNRRMITANPGGAVNVSEEMAARLLRDFPNLWRPVDEGGRRGFRPGRDKMTNPSEDKNNGPLQRR